MAIIILIPLCILFAVVWSSKSIDKKHEAEISKKLDKTNLPLQHYYTRCVKEIIDKEYNSLIENGFSERDAIVSLFHKYNMPLREYFEGEYFRYSVIETTDGLIDLLVKKQIKEIGYKFSNDGKPSASEQRDKSTEVFDKMKKDYWWL